MKENLIFITKIEIDVVAKWLLAFPGFNQPKNALWAPQLKNHVKLSYKVAKYCLLFIYFHYFCTQL